MYDGETVHLEFKGNLALLSDDGLSGSKCCNISRVQP